MRNELEAVLRLQPQYTHTSTSQPMRDRGAALAALSGEIKPLLANHAGMPEQRTSWKVASSNGIGNASKVPWLRVFDPDRSPSARDDYYLVYLFSEDGSRAYLSLNQGTTEQGAGAKRVSRVLLADRARVGREILAADPLRTSRWAKSMNLGPTKSGLGGGYELGNIYALEYRLDSMPTEGQLVQDLEDALQMQAHIYYATTPVTAEESTDTSDADEAGPEHAPEETQRRGSPEVDIAEQAIDSAAGKLRKRPRGAGRPLSGKERRAIEQHAVRMTTGHLEELGYRVEDVGATSSYDLKATADDGAVLHVEVKGTTSLGGKVVLTSNEVTLHQDVAPHNALAIVHSINYDRVTETVTGGELDFKQPWIVDTADLAPIAYTYITHLSPEQPSQATDVEG